MKLRPERSRHLVIGYRKRQYEAILRHNALLSHLIPLVQPDHVIFVGQLAE